MIRNEYFTGSDGYGSLPIFITLMQYNDNWNVPTFFNHNIEETSTPRNIKARSEGTIGGSQFQFTFDCVHEIINTLKLQDPFSSINKELANNNFPTFSREKLQKEYYIISIPDVGQESKSLGYRDFVPQVWYKQKKIWQIYVGLIRNYTSKTAYSLIPKTGTNINLTGADVNKDFYIRCAWKNNIEDLSTSAHDIMLYLKPNQNIVSYSDKNKIPMYWVGDHYEITAEIPTFVGLDLLDWYDIYFVDGDYQKVHLLNAKTFFFTEYARDEVVTKQGDYYREAFFREYFYKYTDPEEDYLGKTRLITLKAFLKKAANDRDMLLILRPRANTYDCYYQKGNRDARIPLKNLPFIIEKNADITIFNKAGDKISNLKLFDDDTIGSVSGESIGSINSDGEYEIIPEYTSRKKYEYKFTNGSGQVSDELVCSILYSNDVTPWNIETPEVILYNENGSIVLDKTIPASGVIEIYSNYDLGDTTAPTTTNTFVPTKEFYQAVNNSEYYTFVSNNLSENTSISTFNTAVFPLMTEDYTNESLINEQSKVIKNDEIKLHRVIGSESKEYMFLDNPNIDGINTFRDNLSDLLVPTSDELEVTIDKDLDNLKAALWSLFCATSDSGNRNILYNTIDLTLAQPKESAYDAGAYTLIDSRITNAEYIVIPCDNHITASYVSLLSEATYNNDPTKKFLKIENTSIVKMVEYTPGRCALIYIAPNDMSQSQYKYLYIPNWISFNDNKIYTLKHSS